jgi:hypothetical protein
MSPSPVKFTGFGASEQLLCPEDQAVDVITGLASFVMEALSWGEAPVISIGLGGRSPLSVGALAGKYKH